jgi:DNA-binding MarR family transcriptional regulator
MPVRSTNSSPRSGAGAGSRKAPRSTASLLHSAAIHLLRTLRKADRASGIGPAQLSALSVLVFRGPCGLGDLAEAEGVKAPTMTRIVDALERGGLARRERAAGDRRAFRVFPTKKGVRLLRAAQRARLGRLQEMLDRLPREQVGALRRAAEIIEGMVRGRG